MVLTSVTKDSTSNEVVGFKIVERGFQITDQDNLETCDGTLRSTLPHRCINDDEETYI